MSAVGSPRPASALTANENWITKVYADFLDRGPSNNERTFWSAWLSSHSRLNTAYSIFALDEFADLWSSAMGGTYLEAWDSGDPVIIGQIDALYSSADFLASEVTVLASGQYFAESGGTNTSYVTALYEDVLLRAPDPSGLAYWVGRLNAGTSSRSAVASAQIKSTEASTRRVAGTAGATSCASTALIDFESIKAGSYCIVLDRMADPSGSSYWTGQLASSAQLPDLWASLASSTEYFNHAQP